MKDIYRTGTPWEEEWSIYRRQGMSGQGYNADRYEEIDDAIRFAHEGGTQWASADNREKNNLAQFRANVDEEILKGYFSQNKK